MFATGGNLRSITLADHEILMRAEWCNYSLRKVGENFHNEIMLQKNKQPNKQSKKEKIN